MCNTSAWIFTTKAQSLENCYIDGSLKMWHFPLKTETCPRFASCETSIGSKTQRDVGGDELWPYTDCLLRNSRQLSLSSKDFDLLNFPFSCSWLKLGMKSLFEINIYKYKATHCITLHKHFTTQNNRQRKMLPCHNFCILIVTLFGHVDKNIYYRF